MAERIKNSQARLKRVFVACLDILCVIFASYAALIIKFDLNPASVTPIFYETVWKYTPINIAVTLLVFYLFKLYHSLWLYAGMAEIQNIIIASTITSFFQFVYIHLFRERGESYPLPRSYYLLYYILFFMSVLAVRFLYRALRRWVISRSHGEKKKVMLIGAGDSGHMILRELEASRIADRKVMCIIDDDKNKHNSLIHGVKIVGGRDRIIECAEKYSINEIIIAIPSASRKDIKEITNICKETKCNIRITPGLDEIVNGKVSMSSLREVSVEDLLGREPVKVDINSIAAYVKDKTVLVTGGGGSIGSELCRQIAKQNPKLLVIVDIYENNAYDIQNELKRKYPDLKLEVLIASVRNTKRLDYIFSTFRPEIVFHAAAHKHVPLMEDSPNEALKNNVLGTWKTVKAADQYGVKKFVLISTDKAVNPTSVMGATKRICEMIIQTYSRISKTDFVAVRFGNVLGSNGSVIPLFKNQIANGGPVTVTHPDIIRYFMTIPEAVSLVLQAGAYAKGGEIFVLEMGEPVKILDLATNLIKLSGYVPGEDIEIVFTGLRPGEKLYEETLMAEEGLQETENKLIHIGKPIEMDEEGFIKDLEDLKKFAEDEPDGEAVRNMIKKLVPTYVATPNNK